MKAHKQYIVSVIINILNVNNRIRHVDKYFTTNEKEALGEEAE